MAGPLGEAPRATRQQTVELFERMMAIMDNLPTPEREIGYWVIADSLRTCLNEIDAMRQMYLRGQRDGRTPLSEADA